jgi:hypothetical protein
MEATIEAGFPACGCIVWQEGEVGYVRPCGSDACAIQKAMREWEAAGHGAVVKLSPTGER